MSALRFLLIIILLGKATTGPAQNLFQSISFSTALGKAARENKLILLYYESDQCEACNTNLDKAFSSKTLYQKIKNAFIPVKISANSKDRMYIRQLYDITGHMGLFFIDSTKELVYSNPQRKEPGANLDALLDEALKHAASRKTLAEKERRYFKSNTRNRDDLEALIIAKSRLDQPTGLLLVEYLHLIPKDSVNTLRTIQFVARQAPVLGSVADQTIRKSSRFDTAWYDMPLPERIAINKKIFKKSTRIAADNADEPHARSIAAFAAQTYDNEQGKQYIRDVVMMSYYQQTKNPEKFMAIAVDFYDRYASSIPPVAGAATTDITDTTDLPDALKNIKTATVVNAIPSTFAYYLYTTAYYFYRNDTQNRYLEHSLAWTKKALDLYPHYNILHLYALFLYKTGRKNDAIAYATRAIEKSTREGYPKEEWKKEREKMRKGLPLE
ncbi:hypothetical protein [Niabella beijingensis]|uniref:hypothetical protein n=1 Tax=Niabella beijingensis TaxID=2872700 RepID=UPI001CBDF771|nr:hypothetical protein [Niabella beijingensis]MBZ4191965.1 hypothetical protein [Niabella beijingensis]